MTLKPVEKIETKPKAEEKKPEPKKSEQKQTQVVAKTETPAQTQVQQQKPAPKTEPKPAPQPPANTTKSKICFVAIDSEGPVVRKVVSRTVSKESPMGDALNQLLAGPSSTEAKTQTAKNNVLIISFSFLLIILAISNYTALAITTY